MKPRKQDTSQGELFERELSSLVRLNHPLVKLSSQIKWDRFEERFGELYSSTEGRPGNSTRLMVGLSYLKYLHDLSDEETIYTWLENPYWQFFCGERYFQHKFPCNPSSLTRWRKLIGEKGAEELFNESLSVAREVGLLKMSDFSELYVDTTVQEKNIAYPSDANLLNRCRKNLVKLAYKHSITLRQSYKKVGQLFQIKAHRYAHAKQWNRARKAIKKLKTFLGRIVRELERKLNSEQKTIFEPHLLQAKMLLAGVKIYSLHEPEVEAISKGKMHKRYEYGVKVSVVTTRRNSMVLSCQAIHGNPYDGHTLKTALADVEARLGKEIKNSTVGVDLGYRGHKIKQKFKVIHPRLKISKKLRKFIRGRSKIEAAISFMKRCTRLGRNYLKGKLGDLMNALFAAASNMAAILRANA